MAKEFNTTLKADPFDQTAGQELEQMTLAMIINDNSLFYKTPFLTEDSFHFTIHKKIFKYVSERIKEGHIVSMATMAPDWKGHKVREGLTVMQYVMHMVGATSGIIDIVSHAEQLQRFNYKRDLLTIMEYNSSIIREDPNADIDGLQQELENKMLEFNISNNKINFRTEQQVGFDILEEMCYSKDPDSTGLPSLDHALGGGLYPQRMYVVTAESGHGKTMLMSTISANLSEAGKPHLYIALESGATKVYNRTFARKMGVNCMKFFTHKKDKRFINDVTRGVQDLTNTAIFIDSPNLTYDMLRTMVMTAKKRYDINGFFLDYFQLLVDTETRRTEVQFHQVISQWLEQINKDLDTWSFIAGQANDDGSVRGGKALHNACDMRFNLHKIPNPMNIHEETGYMLYKKSRYKPGSDVGNKDEPAFLLDKRGPYFRELKKDYETEEVVL